jgi:hypothetical protein
MESYFTFKQITDEEWILSHVECTYVILKGHHIIIITNRPPLGMHRGRMVSSTGEEHAQTRQRTLKSLVLSFPSSLREIIGHEDAEIIKLSF